MLCNKSKLLFTNNKALCSSYSKQHKNSTNNCNLTPKRQLKKITKRTSTIRERCCFTWLGVRIASTISLRRRRLKSWSWSTWVTVWWITTCWRITSRRSTRISSWRGVTCPRIWLLWRVAGLTSIICLIGIYIKTKNNPNLKYT